MVQQKWIDKQLRVDGKCDVKHAQPCEVSLVNAKFATQGDWISCFRHRWWCVLVNLMSLSKRMLGVWSVSLSLRDLLLIRSNLSYFGANFLFVRLRTEKVVNNHPNNQDR